MGPNLPALSRLGWLPLGLALVLTVAARAETELQLDFVRGTASLTGLSEAPAKGREAEFLVVRVLSPDAKAELPVMAGTYDYAAGTLTFRPLFGFDAEVHYRAEAPRYRKKAGMSAYLTPAPERARPTTVEAVYPEATKLPENHLRFYLHFSAPMSRGFAAKHVRLLDAEGRALDIPFLDLAEELWDREGTRLTLLLDPGRVKSGLVPHEEEGPVIERGRSYTLEIGTGFKDAFGKPLGEIFRRTFEVTAPDTAQPKIEDWGLGAPDAGTREPLEVTFGQMLDHALILRMVEVVDTDDHAVDGVIATRSADTACAFTPDTPWKPGSYRLRVNRLLEDPSGNSIARPFERKDDTFAPTSLRTHVEVAFKIAAPDQ